MIGTLLRKDLIRRFHNPAGFILLVSLPLIFTFLLGSIFRPSAKENILPKVNLLIADRDSSFVSRLLGGAFGQGDMAKMFETQNVDISTGTQKIEEGKASALLIFPDGFQDSLLHEKQTNITLIKNPSQAFSPKIAEEVVKILCEGTDRIFRIGAKPLKSFRTLHDGHQRPTNSQISSMAVEINTLFAGMDNYIYPPLIELKKESLKKQQQENSATQNMLTYLLAGIVVMFLLFNIDTMARDLFTESENLTLQRILTGPVSVRQFIISKHLFLFISGFLAYCLVWLAAIVLFGIRFVITQFLLFSVFSVLLIAALTGIIGFFYTLVKTRSQGSAIAPVFIIVFSALGGAMIPLNALPPFLKNIAVFSPVYWCVDGLQKILIEHFGLTQLAPHIIILVSLTLLLNIAAFFMFARRFRI